MLRTAWRVANFGRAFAMEGQYQEGYTLLTESLLMFHKAGDPWGIALGFRNMAILAAEYGAYQRAACLFGAATHQLLALDASLSLVGTLQHDGDLATAYAH